LIEVAGTTAIGADGQVVGVGDAYLQTQFILRKIECALSEAGATINDVVRTRIFVIDIADWEAVGKAHGQFFREIKPATTMLEISALIDPEMRVEIEVTALIDRLS
jgi:enamine deaminase RidA (YjgF/YER057c/UK114 family)